MRTLTILFCLFTFFSSYGQILPGKEKKESGSIDPATIIPLIDISSSINNSTRDERENTSPIDVKTIPYNLNKDNNFKIVSTDEHGKPTFMRGRLNIAENRSQSDNRATVVKNHLRKLNIPEFYGKQGDFKFVRSKEVAGETHIEYQQYIGEIPIYSGELMVHLDKKGIYAINGRTYKPITPRTASFTEKEAREIAYNAINQRAEEKKSMLKLDDVAKLMYYPDEKGELQLVYKVNIYPEIDEAWEMFIHAQSGEVIEKYQTICQFHKLDGPATTTAVDLNGINRTLHTYEAGGVFFMIDASREMFINDDGIPNNPKGVIWTVDAHNTFPGNSDFSVSQITSSNNSWNSPVTVSAHFNAAKAYEYYRSTFDRNSIDNRGGRIVSCVNVTDENGNAFDNAFWNGAVIYYGNGAQNFSPLAGALDVAGHEMSHGVIQHTANLEYQDESGAINESMADVFGVMIDRDNWEIGEDIVTSSFPADALRDMSDPNNGGSQIGDPGYQPDHYDDRYTGTQDNGGVHINSGIPNHAFYLLAEEIGKDKAERIYYHALVNYLERRSDFSDLRASVEQAALDLYDSSEMTAVSDAFAAVGIGEGGSTGGNGGTTYNPNPGNDWIYTVNNVGNLTLVNGSGNTVGVLNENVRVKSKPSVTDDGRIVVYVNEQGEVFLHELEFGSEIEIVQEGVLIDDDNGDWGNVAISKDGQRLALVSNFADKTIYGYDFAAEESISYELYNPTFTEGVKTGSVLYADAVEFDHSGNYVIYDAYNEIENEFGETLSYWDIGFLRFADGNQWGNGDITSLFGSLPEGISVGNPSLANTSSAHIAIDIIEDSEFTTTYNLGIVNISESVVSVLGTNTKLSYPCFSRLDDKILFSTESNGTDVIATAVLNEDKTALAEDPIYFTDGEKAVWFADGERTLDVEDEKISNLFSLYPNPVRKSLKLRPVSGLNGTIDIKIFNSAGKLIQQFKDNDTHSTIKISVDDYIPGVYFLHLLSDERRGVKLFIVQ